MWSVSNVYEWQMREGREHRQGIQSDAVGNEVLCLPSAKNQIKKEDSRYN